MTDFATDILTFANRTAPGATANIAKMYGKNVGGVSSLVVQSSDAVEHQLAPTVASTGGVPYSALTNVLTLGGGATIADVNTAQNIFPAARDTITLEAGAYKVRAFIYTVRTGAVSCTASISLAGTATYGTVGMRSWGKNSASLTANNGAGMMTAATGSIIGPTSSATIRSYTLDGMVVITVGGTCIPQITFSVAPGSTTTISATSFWEMVRVGTSSFVQQGGWT